MAPSGVVVHAVGGLPHRNRHRGFRPCRDQGTGQFQRDFGAAAVQSDGGKGLGAEGARAAEAAQDPQEPAAVILHQQAGVQEADQLLRGVPEQAFGGRIEEGDGSVGIEQQQTVGTLLKQGLRQSLFHVDASPQALDFPFHRQGGGH